MKREFKPVGVMIAMAAAALFTLGAVPAFSQGRPNPQGHGGGGEHAVSRPSGGGGSSTPASSGGGSSTSSSSGGSSVGSGSGGGDHAVSRGGGRAGRSGSGGAARGEPRGRSVILPSTPSRGVGSVASEPGDRNVREPRSGGIYARPRGDRPANDRAVPRDITNVPIPPNWNGGGWYYYWPWGYGPSYYYGCYYYGCMYYDPFWWDYYYGYAPGYYYGGSGGGYVSSDETDYDTGALKLKVKPRNAQVYVDGYFSGVVDDFDGVFQKLKLRAGAHRVELRAEGYQPQAFDVLIVSDDTVTYRAEMKKP